MNPEDIAYFFKNIPPFQFLDDKAIRNIAQNVTVEFYPKGTLILQQGGHPSKFLRVIKKGGVKVYVNVNADEEIVIDYRSEGDSFGLLSLMGGDRSRANVISIEDTYCYLLSKQLVKKIIEEYPVFSEYFYKSLLNKYIDKTYKEMQNKSLLYGGGDKLLFTTPVGELSRKKAITASMDISIKEAASIMSKNRISSLILTDKDNFPAGIVTDRDLRDKVVAKGKDLTEPISSIMSVPLMKVEARDYCFEALLKMIRYNIHHLLVVDEGRLVGVITNHDMMILQGTSPISVVREIESQQTVEGLVPVSNKINKIVALLLKEGAKASNITRIITEINDRLVKKIIEIAERKFGRPPLKYCWIVFGSEGRKEQTFKTDQDNAIIYEDPITEDDDKLARDYFLKFSEFIRDSLVRCGFPLCPAGYMASNPKWCQPLKVWSGYFSKWINSPTPEAILFSLIFFDFRPVYGDIRLAEMLRSYLDNTLRNQNIFFARMAGVITNNRPPLGFFKSFIVEKSGEHKDELNLKIRGIGPIVDLVRLFALECRIHETSTLDRIKALRDSHPIVIELGDELEQAFEFITLMRIHHQIEQIEQSLPPDNFINPRKLTNLEKKTLKESFQLILKIQDAISELYAPGMVNR